MPINWTNRSVSAFAKGRDPVAAITQEARELVLGALEAGWEGPPYNPLYIAEMLDIEVVPNSSIPDARLLQIDNRSKIEFNPQQARERLRFSIAHEIAHFLFPDWSEKIRNRSKDSLADDSWQLEMLCNLAASEFVLPIGSISSLSNMPSIETLLHHRHKYDVSAEAFFIRLTKVSTKPMGLLITSPHLSTTGHRTYRVDYYISSPTSPHRYIASYDVPLSSIINDCTAIGHTDKAEEEWIIGSPTTIECVGIPGYPGTLYPRVLALSHFDKAYPSSSPIRVVHGNIFEPRGEGPKLLCQLVNDRATKWGGGVARQAARRFPQSEEAFTESFLKLPRDQRLGNVIFTQATSDITVASMIAQHGFGRSLFPKIRYRALAQCLSEISTRALEYGESIHMPKVGTGDSGGNWGTIEELLDDLLIRSGLNVMIYELPPKRPQLELF